MRSIILSLLLAATAFGQTPDVVILGPTGYTIDIELYTLSPKTLVEDSTGSDPAGITDSDGVYEWDTDGTPTLSGTYLVVFVDHSSSDKLGDGWVTIADTGDDYIVSDHYTTPVIDEDSTSLDLDGTTVGTTTDVTNGVSLAAGAVTDASLAGNMETVFETHFGTNYNATRQAWVTNAQDFVGTTGGDPFNGTIVAASVTGAVGSVTGNVGGNVVGSVGSISGITFPTNFGDLSITATTGRVDVDSVAGTSQTANDNGADINAILLDTGTDGVLLAATATSPQLVDDVWDEDVDESHQTAGTAGKKLDDAGAAGDPWSTALPGAYGAGTAGYILGTQGATGTGLSAIPWNSAWSIEVESEATDALAAYDPPTNAEMEARTLVAASYFDAAADTVTLANGPHGGAAATITLSDYSDFAGAADPAAIWEYASRTLTSTGTVTVVGPVLETGELSLVYNDDYLASQSRRLEWSSTDWPDVSGATINFSLREKRSQTVVMDAIAGTVVSGGGATQTVGVEITATDWANVDENQTDYLYDVQATISGKIVTLVLDDAVVAQDVTD